MLVEQSVLGWKEFELEVIRDHRDNAIVGGGNTAVEEAIV